MGKSQPISAQKGEVVYRRKLYKDFLAGKESLNSAKFKKAIKGTRRHQNNARQAFRKLSRQKISFTPFLDLGSAFCTRSMVLTGEFAVQGVACDLSFAALKFSPLAADVLNYKSLPLRIVCDVNCLPFVNNSFPFVFTFQTLHHLVNPRPVLDEVCRVLAPGGYFYLGEEPVKQIFNLNLWRRGSKKTFWEKILMAAGILPFITRIGKEEIKHGILEEAFSLGQWQQFLQKFPQIKAEIKPFKLGQPVEVNKETQNWLKVPLVTRGLLFLLGGGINALCRADKKGKKAEFNDLIDLLACPECADRPRLLPKETAFSCPECGKEYKIVDEIIFLLPKRLEKKLYRNKE